MSFKSEVQTENSGKGYGNALRFATRAEAEAQGVAPMILPDLIAEQDALGRAWEAADARKACAGPYTCGMLHVYDYATPQRLPEHRRQQNLRN